MEEKRAKLIKNIKTGGNMMMYIGSAGLINPIIRRARDNQQSSALKFCTTATGAVVSIGIGNIASKWLNKAIDTIADFIDDVNPKKPAVEKNTETKEETHG